MALTEGEWVSQPIATGEVHAKVAGDECDGGEEHSNHRHDHHEVVRS